MSYRVYMTSHEHRKEADRVIGEVVEPDGNLAAEPTAWTLAMLKLAQVHATLATVHAVESR